MLTVSCILKGTHCHAWFSVCVCGQILACVVEQLETAGFFTESIPKSRLFVTVHDAVLHILRKLGQTDFVLVSPPLWMFITLLNSPSFSLVIAFTYSEMFLPSAPESFSSFFRMGPATLRCDQQGSDCSTLAIFFLLLFLGCWLFYCSPLVVIVPSHFSGGKCTTLTWRLVAMEIQGAVAVATGFLWYPLMR